METVTVHIGALVFDHADYDADGDVLYLHVGSRARLRERRLRKVMFFASRLAPIGSSASWS